MVSSTQRRGLTIWRLAEVILEETEKEFCEQSQIESHVNSILERIVRNHVSNVELLEDPPPGWRPGLAA